MAKKALSVDYAKMLEALGPGKAKNWPVAVAAVMLIGLSPVGLFYLPVAYMLHVALSKKFWNYVREQGALSESDAENIERIISAGQKAGLEELEIEIEKERFEGLRAKLQVPKVNIGFEAGGGLGGEGKYKIRAKYRDPVATQ